MKEKRKPGRPSKYNQEIADAICLSISQGHSLRKICASNEIFPDVSTVCQWSLSIPEFAQQYAHARRLQAELLADELFSITDDESRDISGELSMPNSVAVQRDRLRTDTRKWYLSKVLPKVYGDKLALEHSGEIGLADRIAKARKRDK